MNSRTWTRTIALTLFAAVSISVQLAAQDKAKPHHSHQYHHYQIVDPGTFGGPSSGLQNPGLPRAGVLNNRGTLVGTANTTAVDPYSCFPGTCNASDAFQYQDGVITDLGRLPGGIDSQANWISGNGLIAGLGDNGVQDPLAGFPLPYLHGLLWDHGIMTDLGTLPEGGNLVFPTGVNNRGEVVGNAQNTVPDPNSMFPPYPTQTRAFYWKDGVMQDLGTLPGGTDAAAALINERGQVVGWSYINSIPSPDCTGIGGFVLTTDSFIWDKKNGMKDIGGLGGTCTLANDFNNQGQIVGGSSLAGDTQVHPFVWSAATGVTDLLDPSDSSYGFAEGENAHGDVAGGTCDAVTCYAVLWRKIRGQWQKTNLSTINDGAFSISINSSMQVVGNWFGVGVFLSENGGPMVDLSTLIPPNSTVQLSEADQINDRGEIAAAGVDANGNGHALLLIPCDENHPGVSGCDYDLIDAETAAARVSLDPAQHPKALAPGVRMPGLLNRFPLPRRRPTPGHGTVPPAAGMMALSTKPANTDRLADHLSAPLNGPSLFCEIANGVLTGGCVQTQGANKCQVTSNGCPAGTPASLLGPISCANGSQVAVSTAKCFGVPGFDLSASALTPATLSAGGSATSTLTVSNYGSFGGTVAFTCSVQPSPIHAPTCSVSPSSAKSGTPATLTISTSAPGAALLSGAGSGFRYALWLPLFGLVLTGAGFSSKQKSRRVKIASAALTCMLFAGLALQPACGSSSNPGTTAGQYVITVTGTALVASGTEVNPLAMPPLTVQ